MIVFDHVTFTYGAGTAGGIRDIDLTIPEGQVVVLCGESGCGKTTLTRLINGLIPHYFEGELTGSVTVSGKNVSQQPLYDTARLDLTPYLERHPASLSGGQKQRLAVASAMAAERSVVFLDEPTSGLDYRHMLQTAQLLRELRQSGRTVYVITHDPEFICQCCTDILHLEAGAIAQRYPLDEAGAARVRAFFRIP